MRYTKLHPAFYSFKHYIMVEKRFLHEVVLFHTNKGGEHAG